MIKPCIFEVEKDVEPDPRCCHSKKEPWPEMGAAIISHIMGWKV